MKKTISLLLFLLLLTNLAWSWEILMEEGFEGSFTPAGWTNQSYGDHEWQQTSSNVHTGECSAFYSGNTSDDNYAFFILPVIYPPSLNKPVQLVYWEYVENPGDYEQLQIIFTEIPQDFHSWTTLDAYNGVETWTEKTCGIPAQFNDNDNFQIGFKYRERTGSLPPVWYIDNVRIETLPRNAPGLPHDPIPADGATDISTTGTLEWQFGSYTDNYVLWFGEKDNMSQGFYENAHTYSPYSYSVLNSGTEYEWQIISYNHDNLTTEGPVWSFTTESGAITSFPYTEGFENWSGSPFAPVGWTVLDLNLDGTWGKGTSSPHSGSSKAYSSGGEDDWLITPQFGLYDATGYNLKWWDKTSFSNDYEVLVSTETNDHEVFLEEALGTYNITNSGWALHTLDISDYCGDEIYLAFHQTNSDGYGLSIDDMAIEEIPPSGPIFSINPETKDFGNGYIDQNSFGQTFTISNVGVGTIEISSVTLGGTNNNQFTLTDGYSYPHDLDEGESITLSVAFSPTSTGDKTASLSVESSTKVSHSATLTGKGIEQNYCTSSTGTGGYCFANNLASGAPSAPSYDWLDISSSETDVYDDLTNGDGYAGGAGGYEIGFTFNFFGVDYTKFWLSADGFISFGADHDSYENQYIPTATTPNAEIALFWDDLNPITPVVDNAAIYYQSFGSYLVITYENMEPYTSPSATKWFTAQAILFANGNIKLQYKDKGADMPIDGCTIGIENGDGTCAVNYHYNDAGGPIFPDGKEGEIAVMFGEDEGSLPVILSSFTAEFSNNMPTLSWVTESETDNLGWYVYRNTEEEFSNSLLVSELIEGYGTTTEQHSYFFEDQIENLLEGTTYYYWLESINLGGVTNHYDQTASLTIPDNIQPELPETPITIGLYQNCPNPFKPSFSTTNISFYLEEGTNTHVKIEIYNIKGELVKTIWNQYTVFEKNPISAFWDGCDENGKRQATGIYFYRMQADGDNKEIKKLILF